MAEVTRGAVAVAGRVGVAAVRRDVDEGSADDREHVLVELAEVVVGAVVAGVAAALGQRRQHDGRVAGANDGGRVGRVVHPAEAEHQRHGVGSARSQPYDPIQPSRSTRSPTGVGVPDRLGFGELEPGRRADPGLGTGGDDPVLLRIRTAGVLLLERRAHVRVRIGPWWGVRAGRDELRGHRVEKPSAVHLVNIGGRFRPSHPVCPGADDGLFATRARPVSLCRVVQLARIVQVLDRLYDPALARDWDAIGLVCGDPEAEVEKVLFAVDPVHAVVREAIDWQAGLIVTHHPLFLRGVHSVAATTPKGRLVHTLLTNGVGLHVCHTNADAANPGVSDALAAALGLDLLRPVDPDPSDPALGIGRIGELPAAEPLSEFRRRVSDALPPTAHGVRVAGHPDRPIRRVAVSGGAGDSYLDAVRAHGVDAYVTADLRHHPSSEFGEHQDAPALLDVAHWASEWPWLADAASRLLHALEAEGTTVETRISTICTDPWSTHVAARGGNAL